jgi:hypothetical protein
VAALFRKSTLFSLGLVILLLPAAGAKLFVYDRSFEDPLDVARSYLQAIHAQDHLEAYRHISAADRRVANQADYAEGHRSLSGFALQLAKIVAAQTEFRLVEQEISGERARLTINYKVPATDELSSLLLNWDEDKLDALSRAGRQRIIGVLENMNKARNVITTEGRETFNLINEDGRWKIFLDWASGIQVSFDAALPANSAVEVDVLKRKLFAGVDEPFQTNLKLRNRSKREVIARIEHRIEPIEYAGHIAMIACGFLRPLTLQPGEEREVSSAYLLDPGLPKNTAFRITFQFNLASASRPANVISSPKPIEEQVSWAVDMR